MAKGCAEWVLWRENIGYHFDTLLIHYLYLTYGVSILYERRMDGECMDNWSLNDLFEEVILEVMHDFDGGECF